MASITKRPESKYWICCYTAADGRQLKKSTKQTKRDEAMRVCLDWQDAEEKSRKGLITEAQARRVLAEIVERTCGEKMEAVTTRDFFDRWLHSKELSKAEGTARRYRHTAETFLKLLGTRADLNIGAVRPSDIECFRDQQTSVGKSAATANMAVKTLRIVFNLARRQGLVAVNPAEAVELLPADGVTRKPFTEEQIQILLKACVDDPEWTGMILIGQHLGMRIGDAANLTTDNILEEKGGWLFSILPSKRRRDQRPKPHVIPLPLAVITWLKERKLSPGSPKRPLFPSLHGQRLGGCNGVSAKFQKLMKRAGVIQEFEDRDVSGKGRRVHLLTFHSLRHTATSRMANAGVDREIRKKIMGHTSDVHDRYTHHEVAVLRAAVEKAAGS